MPPINCINCGTLFMRHGPLDIDNKHCNNCKKTKVEIVNKAKIVIEVSPKDLIDIEEYCLTAGTSLSDYFIKLHNINMNAFQGSLDKKIEEVQEDIVSKSSKDKYKKK